MVSKKQLCLIIALCTSALVYSAPNKSYASTTKPQEAPLAINSDTKELNKAIEGEPIHLKSRGDMNTYIVWTKVDTGIKYHTYKGLIPQNTIEYDGELFSNKKTELTYDKIKGQRALYEDMEVTKWRGEERYKVNSRPTGVVLSSVTKEALGVGYEVSVDKGWNNISSTFDSLVRYNYINEDYTVVKGWKEIDNKWYYFDNVSGVMKVGWQYIERDGAYNWYYFYSSGDMAKDTVVDGLTIDSNGVAKKL